MQGSCWDPSVVQIFNITTGGMLMVPTSPYTLSYSILYKVSFIDKTNVLVLKDIRAL